jgi:hypothetical protein
LDTDVAKDAAAFAGIVPVTLNTVYLAVDVVLGIQQLRKFNGTNFEPLVYVASNNAPSSDPLDGTYWYDANFSADIMVSNGVNWLGYRQTYPNTDPNGVMISGSSPLTQSDGTALVEGDLWIDSSDLENYPMLYRFDENAVRFVKIDKTDQTTPLGVVFSDARSDSGTTFTGIPNSGAYAFGSTESLDMALSSFVDPDAPDARTYPAGMLLFNTRYSTNNVKVWRPLWFREGGFDPNTNFSVTPYDFGPFTFPVLSATARWVNASGNATDGSPYSGRKAQRIMVVRALSAAINANDEIRAENVFFNLIATPGYPELIDEMVNLNIDQGEVSHICADPPIRLAPNSVGDWASNKNNASGNGEVGLLTKSADVSICYPWGLAGNIDGSDVMIPPSTIALRVMFYSDSVSYVWAAPAGTDRGRVTNAAAVGHLTDEGEFKAVILNKGQRDVLYSNNINPIEFSTNYGLFINGQKTLFGSTTARDRINVARLCNYIRYNLNIVARPFMFQPNIQQTRDGLRITVEKFYDGIIRGNGIDDYVVDTSATVNTGDRIDRNELWALSAIVPTKTVEFIYLPVILKNNSNF